jgi:uncharacterized membrane protein
MLEKILLHLITEHRGKTIGVLLGLIASILFISFGFWRTIFIALFIFAGYSLGKKLDDNVDFEVWMKNLFKSND